ncbi:MAG: DUF4920 domain-containing protein [Proteobacteria bacterium]|nr:DUF4920 domain-containing protein [Pseudomonadota bacterium]
MGILFTLLGILFCFNPAFADDNFGEGVTLTESVLVSELLGNPDAYVGKLVRVEGLVTKVCAKRGCWISIASDEEFQELRFKVKDGVIVFPPEVKGEQVVAEGIFNKYELTQEQAIARAKHKAEEHGTEFDPSAITGPEVFYQVDGKGAVIK